MAGCLHHLKRISAVRHQRRTNTYFHPENLPPDEDP
jgi:hypothetical protein